MSVKILLSAPAGGKTEYCMEQIRTYRKMNPLAPVKVIVPDKMQMAYWKQVLAHNPKGSGHTSGFIGTEILSFGKFAAELMNTVPGSPELIPARLDSLCVREAMKRAAAEKPLEYFDPIFDKPGVPSVLEQTFRVLERECITPEKLAEVGEKSLKRKDMVCLSSVFGRKRMIL